MDNYPALTIKQPYATLVVRGIKNIENRSWTTDYRGRIFIHAGQSYVDEPLPVDLWLPMQHHFTYGAIMGTAELVDIVQDSDSPWAEKDQHHWVLKNAELWDHPIGWRGRVGLWYPTRFMADRRLSQGDRRD